MGGGGSAPGYEQFHRDFHGWMLGGQAVEGDDLDFDPFNATDGVAGAYHAAKSSAVGSTPYSSSDVFDPELDFLYSALVTEMDDYIEEVSVSKPSSVWENTSDVIGTKIDEGTFYDSTEAKVEALEYRNRIQTDMAQTIAEVNSRYLSLNMLESSARFMEIALIERSYNRDVMDRYEEGRLEYQTRRWDSLYKDSVDVSRENVVHLKSRAQAISTIGKVTSLWGIANRQKLEDELRLSIEDTLWDFKLTDFLNKGLSSISGASVSPGGTAGANETLSTISAAATVASSIATSF